MKKQALRLFQNLLLKGSSAKTSAAVAGWLANQQKAIENKHGKKKGLYKLERVLMARKWGGVRNAIFEWVGRQQGSKNQLMALRMFKRIVLGFQAASVGKVISKIVNGCGVLTEL